MRMKDIKDKDARQLRRIKAMDKASSDNDEDYVEVTETSYMERVRATLHSKTHIVGNDLDTDDKHIRDVFTRSGLMQFNKEGSAVRDNRLTARDEARLTEFAQRQTGGDRNMIVEMGDHSFAVYEKDLDEMRYKRKFLKEFADYSESKNGSE
jgi:hypothetical protein